MEYDAATHSRAAIGNLFLLRSGAGACHALHGIPGRDATYRDLRPPGGDFAQLVDSLRMRHGLLCLLLGDGRGEPGVYGYGFISSGEVGLMILDAFQLTGKVAV